MIREGFLEEVVLEQRPRWLIGVIKIEMGNQGAGIGGSLSKALEARVHLG